MSKSEHLTTKTVGDFLTGRSDYAIDLYRCFLEQYRSIGEINLQATKSMIAIATPQKRIAYITSFGKNFIHIVFPFTKPYPDNACFQKIAQVPGDESQFNHHFRMCAKEDINKEVLKFMKMAYTS